MSVTDVVSGRPESTCFRNIWLHIVAQAIASWCLFLSIFVPIFKQQPEPPATVETYASRYRMLIPDNPNPKEPGSNPRCFGIGMPRNPMVPRPPARKNPSFDVDSIFGSSTVLHTFNEFAALPVRRSYSFSTAHRARFGKNNNIDANGRPRANSDPTGEASSPNATLTRAQLRAKRCVTMASDFATDIANMSTMPARPIIKRARTVMQRSFPAAEQSNPNPNLNDGDELASSSAAPPGTTTTTPMQMQRSLLRGARTCTRNAINRASQIVVPAGMPKADVRFETVELKEEEEIEIAFPPTIPSLPPSRARRPKLIARRIETLTSSRFFARFHS